MSAYEIFELMLNLLILKKSLLIVELILKSKLPKGRKKVEPFLSYGPSNPNINNRELHASASLITIPQQLIGEGIKPTSVRILDNISDVTTDIRDDGDGNLYDFSFTPWRK